jgi:hypothetical protein
LYKAYNEVVGEPSVPLRSKFVKVFTKYLYSRIAALRGEAHGQLATSEDAPAQGHEADNRGESAHPKEEER